MPAQELVLPGTPALHGKLYLPETSQPVPGLVFAHGLLSRSEEFLDFPERFVKAGYAVLTFDFQGHGQSGGMRSFHSAEQHVGDLRRAVETLRDRPEVDADQIYLLGHSLGTVPALLLLGHNLPGIQGGILLAPPSQVRKDNSVAEVLFYWAGSQLARPILDHWGIHLHVPYRVGPQDVYLDPEAQRRGAELNLIQPSLTLNNYDYLIETIDNEKAARSVQLPTLIVAAKEDQVVSNQNSRDVYEALAAEDKEWVRLSPSGHSMMGDYAKDTLFELILDWLARHRTSTPSKKKRKTTAS